MPIWAMDNNGEEPIVENGRIVGYRIEAEQGPTQMVKDINDPETQKKYGYKLEHDIGWADIVFFNASKFDVTKSKMYDKNNPEYKKQFNLGVELYVPNYAEQCNVDVPSPSQVIEKHGPYSKKNIDFDANPVRSTGVSGTISLGRGFSFELGLAYNFKDLEFGPYFNLEKATGIDGGIGIMHNKFTPLKGTGDLTLSDIKGAGNSINGSVWIIDFTRGGSQIQNDKGAIIPYVYDHTGIGGSIGSPAGATVNQGNTWIWIINKADASNNEVQSESLEDTESK